MKPLTPEELAAIRERDEYAMPGDSFSQMADDRRALLAHIDAITEENVRLRGEVMVYRPVYESVRDNTDPAVLALLRGTPQRPDLASEYGRLLAERDRLIAQGVDPSDLETPERPL